MAASLRLWLFRQWWLFLLVSVLAVGSSVHARLTNCTYSPGELVVECSKAGLVSVPRDLPSTTAQLNLSYNLLTSIDPSAFTELTNLHEVHLGHNELTSVPLLGPVSSNITILVLHHNQIPSISESLLKPYTSLEVLDLNSNDLTEVRSTYFPPGLRIRELNLGNNRISTLEHGAFNSLARSLQVLRLSKNRIGHLPVKAFTLPKLTQLDLNRNKLRLIEGLTFQGLDSLEVLKLQRNNISKLTDGAFWRLTRMQVLHLENNSLTEVTSGFLYGLSSLHRLYLGGNSIARISADSWRFCEKLHELNLSYNRLVRLDKGSLAGLGSLNTLRLSHNSLSHITEGAFRGLKSLRILELDHNEISGTIEDTNGAFAGLGSLNKLMLFGNKIKSVARKAFSGLEALEHLNLGNNAIRSIHPDAFTRMKNVKELYMNSDSFLCDCQLKWLPQWLAVNGFQVTVEATCAHPEPLKNRSIFTVPSESFVCDDFPKPQIILQPEPTVAMLGKDVRFTCSAASSSSSPMTFAWKKDNEILLDTEIENFAHVRARDGEVMEYTTILHLRHVTFKDEGRYQCVITNHFGSTYSNKTRLTVNVLPSFIKTPHDLTIRTGGKARLECAAEGHPAPQIAWQKDGGTDFPAARERRMHIMPDDDVLFITNVKIEDMGVYSCTAQNSAGTVSANATLTVLETPSLVHPLEDHAVVVGETVALQCKATGSPPPRVTWLKDDGPLQMTDRHHYTRGNQLLIIQNAVLEDSGKYTCEMSNTLGTERAYSHLSILPSPACIQPFTGKDGSMTVGIIVIAVVCSILITSFVWVCIIYQTRKKSEEYSVTNTDETVVPPDVPSYLSSQGTLSDRQETCIRLEGSRTLQPNGHIESSGECSVVPVVCTDCLGNAGFYSADREYCPQTFKPVDKSYEMPLENEPVKAEGSNFTSSSNKCNGTAVAPKGKMNCASCPSNHDRTASSHTHISSARLDPTSQTSEPPPANLQPSLLDDLYHRPSLLHGNPQTLLDSHKEVKQTLLSNGSLPKSLDSSSECTPLRRVSD